MSNIKSLVEQFMSEIENKYPLKSFYIYIDSLQGNLVLDSIVVEKEHQKQGVGSKVVQDVVDFADEHGLKTILSVGQKNKEHGTTSSTRLRNFYKRFGFVENKGRNKDFTISGGMYRNPQKKYTDSLSESIRRFLSLEEKMVEASYDESDIPKSFRVVFPLTAATEEESTPQQLRDGVLDGVQGISGGKEVIMDFFSGYRDAFLVMNSQDVLKINKLSRIMYDNPYYLLNNNMKMLRRIFSDNVQYGYGQTIFNLFEYAMKQPDPEAIETINKEDLSVIKYRSEYVAAWQELRHRFQKRPIKINDIHTLARWAVNQIKILAETEGWTKKSAYQQLAELIDVPKMTELLYAGLKTIGKVYSGEREWIVKDGSLDVPQGSRLFVIDSPSNQKIVEKYRLKNLYKIIMVKESRFKELRNKYFEHKYNK